MQAPGLARRAEAEVNAREVADSVFGCFLIRFRLWGRRRAQELATTFEVFLFRAIGEEAEMADAFEGGRDDVEQEAADEFIGV